MEFAYADIYDPPVHVVIEQVTDEGPFRWIFSKVGAEMLRINFLIKDSQGNVLFEYKWNLGEAAVSPWVPGNVLYLDVISTWSSEFGGVNHFYFTVDMLWILDTEYVPPVTEHTTTSSSVSTTPSSPGGTTTTDNGSHILDLSTVFIGAFGSSGIILIALFLRRSRPSH